MIAGRNGIRAEHSGGADSVDVDAVGVVRDTAYRCESDRPHIRVGAAGCPVDLKEETDHQFSYAKNRM